MKLMTQGKWIKKGSLLSRFTCFYIYSNLLISLTVGFELKPVINLIRTYCLYQPMLVN